MMFKPMRIGHDFKTTGQMDDYIIPKNIDKGHTVLISTAWNTETGQAITMRFVCPQRSYWRLSPMEMVKSHESIQEAFKFHAELVNRTRSEVHG